MLTTTPTRSSGRGARGNDFVGTASATVCCWPLSNHHARPRKPRVSLMSEQHRLAPTPVRSLRSLPRAFSATATSDYNGHD